MTTTSKRVTVTLAGLTLGAALVASTGVSYSTGTVSHKLPACATEDSTNCVWDATTRGNGKGTSFVNVNGITWVRGDDQSIVRQCVADAACLAWVNAHASELIRTYGNATTLNAGVTVWGSNPDGQDDQGYEVRGVPGAWTPGDLGTSGRVNADGTMPR